MSWRRVLLVMMICLTHGIVVSTTCGVLAKAAGARVILGDIEWPATWHAFGPFKTDPGSLGVMQLAPEQLAALPETVEVDGLTFKGRAVTVTDGSIDFGALFGGHKVADTAYAITTITCAAPMRITMGAGADWWMQWWVNGEKVCDTVESGGNSGFPPSVTDHIFDVSLKEGRNVLVARVIGGNASFRLRAGGPNEIQASLDPDKIIAAMFNRMKLDHPGLEEVKASIAREDLPAAEAAYLEFWRRRTDNVVLWDVFFRLNSVALRNSGASDFFAEPAPVTISWRDREKLRSRISLGKVYANEKELCEWTVLEMANMLLENKLTHIRMGVPGLEVSYMPPVDMGEKWDWNFIANDNPYTNGFLHRFYWAPVLAQTYWATGDERYADKLIDLWVDWVQSPPQSRGGDSGKKGGLGPSFQAALQPGCLEMMLQSPKLSAREFAMIVSYLTGDIIDTLTSYYGGGNQLLSQGQAVSAVAGAFPEFKEHAKWLAHAQNCLTNTCNSLIYPDGGFAETTFSYAVGTAVELLTSVESTKALADRSMNIAIPERARNPEFMGNYFMYNAGPDWLLPWTGHGGRVDATALLGNLARMYPHRLDFLYYATRGKQGEQPKEPSRWFNWSGYCSMRDRYDTDANYLFFDVGPCGAFHKNANKLQIVVASHGRTLLEDRGIHTYSPEKPEFQTYFNYCYGHSTVIVDGKSQSIREEVSTAPLANPWTSNAALDYNAGDYSDGYHPTSYVAGDVDNGVRHHRSVIFVKPDYWIVTDRLLPTGKDEPERSRKFEQLFQYIPCEITQHRDSLSVSSATPGKPNLALIPVSRDGLELEIARGRREPYILGWALPGGQPTVEDMTPAPTVIYRKTGTVPTVMQTVLWPLRAGEAQLPRVERIGDPDNGAVKVTLPDGRVDYYRSNAAACGFELNGQQFHALAALVRVDAKGRVATKDVSWKGSN